MGNCNQSNEKFCSGLGICEEFGKPKFDFSTEEGFKLFADKMEDENTLRIIKPMCHQMKTWCPENWNEILCAKGKGACCEEGKRLSPSSQPGMVMECEDVVV
ncbi:MAG: hypothetical protein CMQ40_07865 [Gammaproteobacteria bacterium]|nr:hypothetical protein [Gammaproteobacteria bacterium]